MKTILYCFICLLLPTSSFAQDVIYSDYQKYSWHERGNSIIGKLNGKIVTSRYANNNRVIDLWTDNLQRIATVNLNFLPSHISNVQILIYNGRLLTLYETAKLTHTTMYAAWLDENGLLIGKPVVLKESRYRDHAFYVSQFNVAISDDGTRLAIYGTSNDDKRMSLNGTVFNEQLSLMHDFKKKWVGDYAVSTSSALLGNNGDFYLPIYTAPPDSKNKDQLHLLTVGARDEVNITKLPFTGYFTYSTCLRMNAATGEICLGGFYRKNSLGNYDGILYALFNTQNSTFSSVKEIPLTAAVTKELQRTFDYFNRDEYYIHDMMMRDDGGFTLIAQNGYGPAMPIRSGDYSQINRVLFLSFDIHGSLEWPLVVNMNQTADRSNSIYSSYSIFNHSGLLRLFANEIGDRNVSMKMLTIYTNGKAQIQPFAKTSRENPDWLPKYATQISDHELLVPCERDQQMCLAKIVF